MTLPPGARLGPYEITAPVGQGGMGEVYRARDTRIDRTVALKILAGTLSSVDDRVSLEREARAVAAGATARADAESREFDRVEKLVADKMVPANLLDRQRALKDSAIADRNAAHDRLTELVNGTRTEVVEQSAAAVAAAQASRPA